MTEYQSGENFLSLSLNTMGFKLMVKNSNLAKATMNTAIKEVATAMLVKLEEKETLT